MPEQGAGRPGSHVLPRPGELNRSRPAGAVRLAPLPDDGPSGPGHRPAAACRNIAGRVGPLRGAPAAWWGARRRSPGRSGRRVSWW